MDTSIKVDGVLINSYGETKYIHCRGSNTKLLIPGQNYLNIDLEFKSRVAIITTIMMEKIEFE